MTTENEGFKPKREPEATDIEAPSDDAGMGHNQPPSEVAILRCRLAEEHAKLTDRNVELRLSVANTPEIVTADNAGDVADLIKMITANTKALEGARVAEKEPYLIGTRTVDGYFKSYTDPLLKDKKMIEDRLTKHQREVADAERRKREEEARAAQRVREAAEREEREAEEALARQAEDARLETERVAREARERRERIEREEREAEKRLAAERKAAADLAAKAEAGERAEVEAKERADREAREAIQRQVEAAERRKREEAEEAAALKRAEEAEAAATKAAAEAAVTAKASRVKAADLNQDRGDLGAVASLRTTWDFEIVNRSQIPFAEIAAHFSMADVEKAVRRYVAAGNRELAGVLIFEQHYSQVR